MTTFLERGWTVVVADLNVDAGERLLEANCQAADEELLHFARCDVSSEPDVEAAVALAVRSSGRLECMVKNAGIGARSDP